MDGDPFPLMDERERGWPQQDVGLSTLYRDVHLAEGG